MLRDCFQTEFILCCNAKNIVQPTVLLIIKYFIVFILLIAVDLFNLNLPSVIIRFIVLSSIIHASRVRIRN
jgi:hypothetical protein